jgi:Domain of unknown function (DUF4307)
MPETAGTTPETAAPDLTELIALSAMREDAPETGRYGRGRGGMSTFRMVTLGVLGLCILTGIVGYIGWEQANPPIQGTIISYSQGADGVTVTFEVDKAADASASCVLDVEDVNGDVIGTATVQVPSGRAKSVQVYTVATTGTVNTAVVESCQIVS